jgi:hypothetical protein
MTATLAGHVDFATFEAIIPDQAAASNPGGSAPRPVKPPPLLRRR